MKKKVKARRKKSKEIPDDLKIKKQKKFVHFKDEELDNGNVSEDDIDKFHTDRDFIKLDDASKSQMESKTEEVLPLLSDSSDDILSDSDLEVYEKRLENFRKEHLKGNTLSSDDDESSDDDNANDVETNKAWGDKKSTYYGADVDDAYFSKKPAALDRDVSDLADTYTMEITPAELEEQEAMAIQHRQLASLRDEDFDVPGLNLENETDNQNSSTNRVLTDVSKLSEYEKLEILKSESPEFFTLINQFNSELETLTGTVLPTVEKDEVPTDIESFLTMKTNYTLSFALNVLFYGLLKASSVNLTNHPVINRLVQARRTLKQLSSTNYITPLEKYRQTGTLSTSLFSQSKIPKVEEAISSKNDIVNVEDDVDEEMDEDAEKRPISYEISKNKGLSKKRKKELRNPRVKHKERYRRAIIRRKGQVKTPRNELQPYAGEPSGIRAGVKHGIRLK